MLTMVFLDAGHQRVEAVFRRRVSLSPPADRATQAEEDIWEYVPQDWRTGDPGPLRLYQDGMPVPSKGLPLERSHLPHQPTNGAEPQEEKRRGPNSLLPISSDEKREIRKRIERATREYHMTWWEATAHRRSHHPSAVAPAETVEAELVVQPEKPLIHIHPGPSICVASHWDPAGTVNPVDIFTSQVRGVSPMGDRDGTADQVGETKFPLEDIELGWESPPLGNETWQDLGCEFIPSGARENPNYAGPVRGFMDGWSLRPFRKI